LFIVAMIALSAIVAGWEAINRLLHPAPVQHLGWVAAAGVIGFAGNELVAVYRIRVGRRIGLNRPGSAGGRGFTQLPRFGSWSDGTAARR
jgi:divalent metal cation (Fe/Co/Zn/Cd) transporter